MSLFSPNNVSSNPLEIVAENYLRVGGHCVETIDVDVFVWWIRKVVSSGEQTDRLIVDWDVRTFRKYDAIGSLKYLSTLSHTPRPIVIIRNITDIPEGDSGIYDNPSTVKEFLFHNWIANHKYNDPKYGKFEINPRDYSIIIVWNKESSAKMNQVWQGETYSIEPDPVPSVIEEYRNKFSKIKLAQHIENAYRNG